MNTSTGTVCPIPDSFLDSLMDSSGDLTSLVEPSLSNEQPSGPISYNGPTPTFIPSVYSGLCDPSSHLSGGYPSDLLNREYLVKGQQVIVNPEAGAVQPGQYQLTFNHTEATNVPKQASEADFSGDQISLVEPSLSNKQPSGPISYNFIPSGLGGPSPHPSGGYPYDLRNPEYLVKGQQVVVNPEAGAVQPGQYQLTFNHAEATNVPKQAAEAFCQDRNLLIVKTNKDSSSGHSFKLWTSQPLPQGARVVFLPLRSSMEERNTPVTKCSNDANGSNGQKWEYIEPCGKTHANVRFEGGNHFAAVVQAESMNETSNVRNVRTGDSGFGYTADFRLACNTRHIVKGNKAFVVLLASIEVPLLSAVPQHCVRYINADLAVLNVRVASTPGRDYKDIKKELKPALTIERPAYATATSSGPVAHCSSLLSPGPLSPGPAASSAAVQRASSSANRKPAMQRRKRTTNPVEPDNDDNDDNDGPPPSKKQIKQASQQLQATLDTLEKAVSLLQEEKAKVAKLLAQL